MLCDGRSGLPKWAIEHASKMHDEIYSAFVPVTLSCLELSDNRSTERALQGHMLFHSTKDSQMIESNGVRFGTKS